MNPSDIWLFQCWILLNNAGKNRKDISPNVIPFIILCAVCSYLRPNTEWQLIISTTSRLINTFPPPHSFYLDSSTSLYHDWLGPEVANHLPVFTMRSWDGCFQLTNCTQRLQIIISCHFCTERLGKNLQQYNKATLLVHPVRQKQQKWFLSRHRKWDLYAVESFCVDKLLQNAECLLIFVDSSSDFCNLSVSHIFLSFMWVEECRRILGRKIFSFNNYAVFL